LDVSSNWIYTVSAHLTAQAEDDDKASRE
jgi:hypothetical protein